MYQKIRSRLQKGISLLEVMLSLSIIAIILVMATRYFFVASTSQNVNKLRRQVSGLVSGIAHWHTANGHSYADLTVEELVNGGYYPASSDYDSTNKKLKNPWGGDITVSGDATGFEITSTLSSASDCKAVAVSAPGFASCSGAVYTYNSEGSSS